MLRATDSRRFAGATLLDGPGYFTFEEFRYDALGRRVWVRARRSCYEPAQQFEAAECRESFVRRAVWDGSHILDEVQVLGDSAASVAAMENDTTAIFLPVNDRTEYQDPNPYYGIVAYTYGTLGTDMPLAATRVNYTDMPFGETSKLWAPFSVVPVWNPHGQPDDGIVADGTSQHDGGRVLCDNSLCQRPAGAAWPLGGFAYNRPRYVQRNWFGSLLEDQQDKSGTLYRRARQYDPATGRFTQEDPIGLAGGMNLYGFAAGDPVNFSDPFGLCAWTECIAQALADWGAHTGGTAGSIALNAGALLNAGLEATGINSAAQTGDDIGNGRIGAAALGIALLAVPGGEEGGGGAKAIAGKITGFTEHGLNQAISRDGVGVSNKAILAAVRNPTRVIEQAEGKLKYVGEDATVVLNKAGEVVTTWARNSAGWRIPP